jgi:hypothetical protein
MSFASQLQDDLSSILTGEFSQAAIFNYGSLSFEALGIYDETFLLIDGDGTAVQSKHPRISVYYKTIEDDLVTELKENNDIIINVKNKDYKIKYVEKDGQGLAMIELKL